MQEWRSYQGGAPLNTITGPDPADISRDVTSRITWWSPGQYLIPGFLTRLGIHLGSALSITSGLSLLCCLLGWIQVAKYFALGRGTTIGIVILIAAFRYSTLPFGIYNGGEVLLQGLTPWIILLACHVPTLSFFRALGFVFLTILAAFFLKLTGLIVVGAALIAGGLEFLLRRRRIATGLVGGGAGAALAVAVLYALWFAHGSTPASGTGWSPRVAQVLFAWGSPWGAGISWTDMLTSLLSALHLGKIQVDDRDLPVGLWLLLPPVVLFTTVIFTGWQKFRNDEKLCRLLTITLSFYAIFACIMSAIYLRGGDVSVEERHLRAVGTLIFVCVIAIVSRLPRTSVVRIASIALCGLMAFYGSVVFAYRAYAAGRKQIDPYSGTRQPGIDKSALDALRGDLAREGDAVIVLPSPDAVIAFPPAVRALSNHIEYETDAAVALRSYHGTVPGTLYVVVPTEIAQTEKGSLLLKEFTDYSPLGWKSTVYGATTVFTQQASTSK